jgi:hypothetical protein
MSYKFKVNNKNFVVDLKKHLLNFLTPTSNGTKYFESPPSGKVEKRQIGRIFLQCHQILNILKSLNIRNKKNFLDIGTGNGMIPRVISLCANLNTMGVDPYLDSEHRTSWQKHNQEKLITIIKDRIFKNKTIDYRLYKKDLKFENYSWIPSKINLKKLYPIRYKFAQIGAHKLDLIKKKFDIVYLKSIEHFSDWQLMFKKLKIITKKNSIIIFKHRSFFSFLGAHRYAATAIPWGHVQMTESEYLTYCKKFHKNRFKLMKDFYYNDLSYPRYTVNELIKTASKYDFKIKLLLNEPPRYINNIVKFTKTNNFWNNIYKNFPRVSSEEIFSGTYHIVLERI